MKKTINKGKKRSAGAWKSVCLLCLFSLLSFKAFAQQQLPTNVDIPSVEMYIRDHKKVGALLIARATLEAGNEVLHSYNMDNTKNHQNICKSLEEYTKAFDVIDLIESSVKTAFNIVDTGFLIKNKLVGYKDLLDRYKEVILKRGKVETADTFLLTVNARCIESVQRECEDMWKYLVLIAGYATGEVKCSTPALTFMVDYIHASLNRIKNIISTAYFETWQFIRMRTTFWKKSLYRSQTIGEMAKGALGKWLERGIAVGMPK